MGRATMSAKVKNKKGLHLLPASTLAHVSSLTGVRSTVTLDRGDGSEPSVADATSVSEIVSLGARHGDTLRVDTFSHDAALSHAAALVISKLLSSGCGVQEWE